MSTMLRHIIPFIVLLGIASQSALGQTTIAFQGFEAAAPCNDWSYTSGDVTTETRRTGTNAIRVGRQGGSNTVTFATLNVAGLTGLQLRVYHSVRAGSGPGMDVREGAVMQVALNGVWTTIGRVGGLSDHNYAWSSATGGSASTSPGCNVYQSANPLIYTVPAGTNTIAFRAFSVSGGSNCTTFNTLMNGNVGSNYDRTDEGFQLDDVSLTTTTTPLPFLWTGRVDTDWSNCRNWRFGVVPTSTSAVTIDQSAVNHCEVFTANAQCASLSLGSNNADAWNLTVRAGRQLAVTNTVDITRTGPGAAVGIILGSTAPASAGTFSCGDLMLTGNGASSSTAVFRNEAATNGMLVRGDVTINAGGFLDLSAGATGGVMELQGDFTNNDGEAALSEVSSLIWFSGASPQSINTTGYEERFGSIRMGKSAGDLTLNDPVRLSGSLELAYASPGGRIISTASTLFSLSNTATATSGTDGSHVDGPLQKFGITDFIYPVGESGIHRPVQLTEVAGSATDAFTVRYRRQSSYAAYGINRDPFLDHVSDCEHWTVVRSSGTSNARVTLSWHGVYSCGVDAPNDLRVAWWDASAMAPLWRDRGNDGATVTPWGGWLPSGEVQNQLGPFTLGSVSAMNPLPIELLYFDARPEGIVVNCNWATVSEIENDHFTVERSADGDGFEPIGSVDAAGESRSLRSYSFTDASPLRGLSYYRLRQTDVDGTTTVSTIVVVVMPDAAGMRAWSDGERIQVHHARSGPVRYRLYEPAGRLVLEGSSPSTSFTMAVPRRGLVYLVEVSDGSEVERQRVVH
ncbi:MAG: hypothetical protein ACO1NQ_08220 [Flavobacteriales bacterium]